MSPCGRPVYTPSNLATSLTLRTLPRCLRGLGLSTGLLLGLLLGCTEPTTDLRSAVELLASARGELAERALERIERHGRTALPYLEAALHRVPPPGRRNIVTALRRLALPESAALLGHIAAFDSEPVVRTEAYRTLEAWASGPPSPRQAAAHSAIQQADEVRSDPS